jgi:hypothetical protein
MVGGGSRGGVVGRASRRKKIRREAKSSSGQAGKVSRADAETRQALLRVVAGLEAMSERYRRRQEQYASACRAWCGGSEPVPAREPQWREESLGGRFFASMHIKEAQNAPSLRTADVPDHKVIAASSVHWAVATNALIRAVVLDDLRPDQLVVSMLLDVLGPIAEAELAYGGAIEAWVELHPARWRKAEPQEPEPEFPEEDGPVLLLDGALVDATWAVVGEDPLSEVHAVLVRVLGDAAPGLEGRVVADALIGAFAREYRCEGPGDAELLDQIGQGVSSEPLENLIAAKAVPARGVLRAGLTILSALAELCSSDSVSILRRQATEAK